VGIAIEQLDVERRFQILDPLAHHGAGHAELARGAGVAARRHYGGECLHQLEAIHLSNSN
jgi:hypothetical protein